jgi:hypothetical protein
MTLVGRAQVSHPALATAGGSALFTQIETIYTNLSDYLSGRFFAIASVANSTTTTFAHNFGIQFADFKVRIYTGTWPNLTRVADPTASGWTIIANVSNLKTQIDVTTPSSGGPFTYAVEVLERATEKMSDISDTDVTTTAPQDGQALVYEASSGKWKPGASGDASFKIQSITTPNAVIKGGSFPLVDGRELSTYDGAGSLSTDFGGDLTVSLTTIFGSAPANATNYYLYIDLSTLGAATVCTDNGRELYPITVSNFFISTKTPKSLDRSRYLRVGFIRSATTGTAWSGTGSAFGTIGAKLYDNLSAVTGEKNYAVSGSSSDAGWAASGAGVTVALDITGSELPRPNTTGSGIKVTGVSGSSAYAYYRFILDDADANKKLKVQFDLKPISGYVASDFKVDVYSNTASDYTTGNTRLALSTDSSAVSPLPNLTGTYRTTFDAPAVSAKYIEIRIGLNGTNTHALVFSDLIVGPGVGVQGAAVSEWVSYTPTGSWVSNTTYTGKYRRIGDSMEVQARATLTGAPTSIGITFSLPTGFTIDNTKLMGTGSTVNPLGIAQIYDDAGGSGLAQIMGRVLYNTTTTVTAMSLPVSSGTNHYDVQVDQANPITFANNDQVNITFRVPIAEWAGSGTVNVVQNDVEYAYSTDTSATASVTNAFGTGPGGSNFGAAWAVGTTYVRRVQFQNPVQVGQQVQVQVSGDGGLTWGEISGTSAVIAYSEIPGSRAYGIYWTKVSATQFDINFGAGGRNLASTVTGYGGNGNPFSDLSGGGFKWRVVKTNAGQAIGFGEVQPGVSAGLVSANGLKAKATNAAAPTGYVGETITSTVTAGSPVTGFVTATAKTITSITLTAGDWDVRGCVNFDGGSTVTQARGAISANTNAVPSNSTTWGTPNGTFEFTNIQVGTNLAQTTLPIPPYQVTVANGATLTLYLVGFISFTGGTPGAAGYIQARRMT